MSRKLALITGGTSGIGLGIAKSFQSKYDLALSYASNHDRAKKSKEELISKDIRVETFPQFIDSYDSAKKLITNVEEVFSKKPEILVNSAGSIRDGMFIHKDWEDHEKIIKEHLIGTMALCHITLKDMYRNKWGRIINISSISATYAKRGQANYAAAKSALLGFTKTLALEVAHRGVTVNTIQPGLIETPMTEEILEKLGREIKKRIPIGYPGKVKDVGGLVDFLCGEEGRYITGTCQVIDGGRSLGDPQS